MGHGADARLESGVAGANLFRRLLAPTTSVSLCVTLAAFASLAAGCAQLAPESPTPLFKEAPFVSPKEADRSIADSTSTITLNPLDANAFNDRGVSKYAKGDIAGAIADLDAAIALNPRYTLAYRNRGLFKGKNHDLDGAIADFDRAIALDPGYSDAFWDRGLDKSLKGDGKGAMADFNEAIELNPRNANAFENRGVLKSFTGDGKGAMADFNEAIELNPRNANAFENRAALKSSNGDSDGAILDISQVLRLDPGNTNALISRGSVKESMGDWNGAVADFTEAARLAPDDSFSNNAAAWALAVCPVDSIRNGANALRYAEKACSETRWSNSSYLDTYATALAETGDFVGARKWERKALRLVNPPSDKKGDAARMSLFLQGKPYRETRSVAGQ